MYLGSALFLAPVVVSEAFAYHFRIQPFLGFWEKISNMKLRCCVVYPHSSIGFQKILIIFDHLLGNINI